MVGEFSYEARGPDRQVTISIGCAAETVVGSLLLTVRLVRYKDKEDIH